MNREPVPVRVCRATLRRAVKFGDYGPTNKKRMAFSIFGASLPPVLVRESRKCGFASEERVG